MTTGKLRFAAPAKPMTRLAMLSVLLFVILQTPLRASTPFAIPQQAPTDSSAQTDAPTLAISGTVLDPSGSFIPGADVSLIAANGKPIAKASSDAKGEFRFEKVPPGKYQVRVTSLGFRDGVAPVAIADKAIPPLRIFMTIAAVSEVVSVNVDDSAPQISTETSENRSNNNIDRDALDRVPVFDQDYITLLSRFLSDDALATSGVSLVVNGIEANGPGVSPSAVQSVKINQDPYSARFARPGRARLEITTKPGTPIYHGTVNFLTRNSFFDASNALATTKPSESRYMEEGSLTGPLGHDKKNSFLLTMEQDNDNLETIVHVTNPMIQDNVPAPERHFFTSFRAFHDFASGDQFWIGYSYERETLKNQGVGGTVLREAGYTSQSVEHEINVSYRHIFSPKWVNQLRFLVGHNDEPIFSNNNTPKIVVQGVFTEGGAQMNSKRTEAHVDGTDFVSYSGGRNQLVFGVDMPDISRRGADDFTNQQGTYTFADLTGFDQITHTPTPSAKPIGFRIQSGNGHLVFWERVVAGYIEDAIRVKPNFSVTVGLRYYFQNYFNNDADNFAPRFSFAYAPSPKSKTVLRGGAGVFYDRAGSRSIADLLHFNGSNLLRFILPLQTNGPVPYPVLPSDLAGVPTSLVVLDPRARIPYIVQYSAGVERQVTAKSTFSATYVGTRGIDLFRSVDANAPPAPNYIARPNSNYGQIRQIQSDGYQKGNSLELIFRGKPTKYLSGQAQYTLGKIYNNTSGITYFPGNSIFPSLDWARSDNDRRHKFDLLGNFEPSDLFSLGVALQAYSGKPVNVTTGLDSNGDGVFNDRPNSGLAPRNSLHGPGLLNLDMNIQHDFKFQKEKKDGPVLTASLNVFNILNHPNYLTYNGVIGPDGGPINPDFRTPTQAFPGRRFQVNLEFKF
jgi:Carboxypeptidase regulatory-like domain